MVESNVRVAAQEDVKTLHKSSEKITTTEVKPSLKRDFPPLASANAVVNEKTTVAGDVSFKDAVKYGGATTTTVQQQTTTVVQAEAEPAAAVTTTSTSALLVAKPAVDTTSMTDSQTGEWVKVVQVEDKPILEEVHKKKLVERHEHVEIVEEIEQPIIEIHEKPIVKNVTHDTIEVHKLEPTKYTLEDHSNELDTSLLEKRPAPREIREADQLRIIRDTPEVVAVHHKQVVERHERPVITEIHQQPILEVHEQPIIRHVVEKPIVRVIREEETSATVTAASSSQQFVESSSSSTLAEVKTKEVVGTRSSFMQRLKSTVTQRDFWVPLAFVGASMFSLWVATRIWDQPIIDERLTSVHTPATVVVVPELPAHAPVTLDQLATPHVHIHSAYPPHPL